MIKKSENRCARLRQRLFRGNKCSKTLGIRNKAARFRKSERGAVAVIAALAMIGILGFTAMAIDSSTWMDAQQHYQNAADAAALSACDVCYLNPPTGSTAGSAEAKAAAISSAQLSVSQNDLTLDYSAGSDQLTVTFDDANSKVTVKIKKPTDNYFTQALNGQDKTTVSATSVAQIITSTTPGVSYGMNSAVEGRKSINWQGNHGKTVTGGIETGGNLSVHSGAHFSGTLLANGNIEMDTSNGTVVDGDVHSGGTVSLSEGGGVFKGNVYSQGNFSCTDTNTTFEKSIYSKGSVSLDRTIVNGDVVAFGQISRTDQGNVIKGSVSTNADSALSNPSDGVVQEGASTAAITIEGTTTTNAGLTDANVPFVPYTWKWDQLKSDIVNKANGIEYTTLTQDLIDKYTEKNPTQKYNFSFDGKNITFYNNSDPAGLIAFCKDTANGGAGSDHPIYIDGSFTLNNNALTSLSGGIIVKDDINLGASVECTSDEMALISLDGDINFTKGPSSVKGMIMTLADESSSKGNINFSDGSSSGTIDGGVVASNSLTMDANWDITADTNWQDVIVTPPSSKKHIALVQ